MVGQINMHRSCNPVRANYWKALQQLVYPIEPKLQRAALCGGKTVTNAVHYGEKTATNEAHYGGKKNWDRYTTLWRENYLCSQSVEHNGILVTDC